MNDDKAVDAGEPRTQAPSLVEMMGVHPLGTAAGVVGGTLAGAVVGLAAGPVGSLVGAVGGALLGGALGAATAFGPEIHVARHDRYWQEHYATRPYVPAGADYADYGPAYRYGVQSYLRADCPCEWHEVEAGLGAGWETAKGTSPLVWEDAKLAARDAWDRMRNATAVPADTGVDVR